MTMKTMLAASSLATALGAGCALDPAAGDAEPTGEAAQEILNGSSELGAYRAVTLTILITPTATTFFVPRACSGTLIASAWVLTAAHCVADLASGIPLPPSSFFVSGAGAVTGVHVMPGWSGRPTSAVPGAADVGLLHLATPLDLPNDANLPCPRVDADHGCRIAGIGGLFPSTGATLHCVSNGPRNRGGSFFASGAGDTASFVANDANRLAGTPWYRYSANASGQTLIQSDEGGGCFAPLPTPTSIRGPLVTVNSFDSAELVVPPSSIHLEYATMADYFRSWVISVIPPQQYTLVVPRGGVL